MKFIQETRPDQGVVDQARLALRDRPKGPVGVASFSVLKNFEECPYRVFLSRVKKFRGEDSPAAARGQEIHDIAEAYIRGESPDKVPPILAKLSAEYRLLREQMAANPDTFELEQEWGFTDTWGPTGWFDDDIWLRQKLDVFHRPDTTSAVICDHKSGKKFGNELKHGDQGLQYAVGALMRYPALQFVETRFLYTDVGQESRKQFTRKRLEPMIPRVEQRIFALTQATEDELQVARPSKANCRFCDHAKSGNCEFAVI